MCVHTVIETHPQEPAKMISSKSVRKRPASGKLSKTDHLKRTKGRSTSTKQTRSFTPTEKDLKGARFCIDPCLDRSRMEEIASRLRTLGCVCTHVVVGFALLLSIIPFLSSVSFLYPPSFFSNFPLTPPPAFLPAF